MVHIHSIKKVTHRLTYMYMYMFICNQIAFRLHLFYCILYLDPDRWFEPQVFQLNYVQKILTYVASILTSVQCINFNGVMLGSSAR